MADTSPVVAMRVSAEVYDVAGEVDSVCEVAGEFGSKAPRKDTGVTMSTMATMATTEDQEEQEEEVKMPSRRLILILCSVGGLEGADGVLLACVFFALQRDLGLTLNNLAAMSLTQALCGNLAAPFWGTMADRGLMSRKAIIVMGCVLQGLITVILAGVNDLTPMLMLRGLNGAMLASLRPIANGIVADVTTEANQGKVFGMMGLTMNIGTMAGTLLGTNIARHTLFRNIWADGIQGWRVAFIIIGGISIVIGALAGLWMEEPPSSHARGQGGKTGKAAAKEEFSKIMRYFRMPTFCVLVLQGCFGAIPWNALGYSTLFFQVAGVTDFQASMISVAGQLAGSAGNILGGVISDGLVKVTPYHGRAITAQISVLSGIPIAYFVFMHAAPEGGAFAYYMVLMTLLGLLATWCGTAVNLPILSQLVQPGNRATIMAWEGTLEGSCSAIFGNAMVGFLAQNVFGYHLESARDNVENDPGSARALGSALMLVTFCPWVVCFAAYSFLHWSYPRDMKRIANARVPRVPKGKSELFGILGKTVEDAMTPAKPTFEQSPKFDSGSPKLDAFGGASPSHVRPRLSASAAGAAYGEGEATSCSAAAAAK